MLAAHPGAAANLIRAVLGASVDVPKEALEQFGSDPKASRAITVALACDPTVRRQRREYTVGRLGLDSYRATEIDEAKKIVRKQVKGGDTRDLPKNRTSIASKLKPGANTCEASTLQVRTWTAPSADSLNPDDGDTYYLVVRLLSERWAKQLAKPYEFQSYSLVIQLEDRSRLDIELLPGSRPGSAPKQPPAFRSNRDLRLPEASAIHQTKRMFAIVDSLGRSPSARTEVPVMAYHSSNPADPDVYHVKDDCPTGQQIPAKNRVPGQGAGNRPCKQCAT